LIDRAAKPDILAPGVGIESLSDPHSTLYARYADYLLSGTRATAYKPYLSLSGTSMAAPVVAGTVALMLEANPRLTPNAVKAILEYTAEARAGESPLAQGAGMVNALGAVRMAKFFGTPDQKLPAPVDTIENEKVEWSQQIQWGNDRVAGGVLLPGANAWAVGTTWGAEATSTGQPIVWGLKRDPSVSWSTNADESIVWSVNGADCIVWSVNTSIVWSVNDDDAIVWSVNKDDSIVWSVNTSIVWSVNDDDAIVWSVNTSIVWSVGTADQVRWPPPAEIDNRRRDVPARQ
jgi:subtilisin family serine protease